MTRSVLSRSLVALATLALLLSSVPGVATAERHGEDDRGCEAGAYAAFRGFTSGSIALQTPNNSFTFEVPRGSAEAMAISLTGSVQVEVEHRCVERYVFTVVKQGPLGPSVIYTSGMTPGCVGGVDVHNVYIGPDAGQYDFYLEWYGCDGTAGKDYRRLLILDPPTPDVGL